MDLPLQSERNVVKGTQPNFVLIFFAFGKRNGGVRPAENALISVALGACLSVCLAGRAAGREACTQQLPGSAFPTQVVLSRGRASPELTLLCDVGPGCLC